MNFEKQISLGNTTVGEDAPVFIIAEAGVNHNGDMKLARELISIAKKSGADAVKFQAFRSEEIILADVEKADYQKEQTGSKQTQKEMLQSLELTKQQYNELNDECQKQGIRFLITPFEQKSLEELDDIPLDAYKVASTDTSNVGFLQQIAARGKPIILSSGMTYESEVEIALRALHRVTRCVTLLHCTSNYPASESETNLAVINRYRERFGIIAGYSDHTSGIDAGPYAVMAGAKILEKHFTIDKTMTGPDHSASLTPDELKSYVAEVRRAERLLGSPIKTVTMGEMGNRSLMQKFLVAKRDIPIGETFSDDCITAKRTGGRGVPAIYYERVIGSEASRSYKTDDPISL